MSYQDEPMLDDEEISKVEREGYKQNLDFDSTVLVSSHGKPRLAAASNSLGHKVSKTNTKDNYGAVHNIDKESTQEAGDVCTNTEISGDATPSVTLKANRVYRQQLTHAKSCGQAKGNI
jgi:hypothetical protein